MQQPFWFTFQTPWCCPGSVSFDQLAIVVFDMTTARPIFLIMKSFSLCYSLSLFLALYSFMSIIGHMHSSSAYLSVIIGPYWWFGPAFIDPNTSQNVIESSVICLAFRVILNNLKSDGLFTAGKAKDMTISRVRRVKFKAEGFLQSCSRSKTFFTSQVSAQTLAVGFFLNTHLRNCLTRGII